MANNKDTYYFSHDANALSDPKILSMRCDYGLEGYGLYWAILEMLRNESTYKLPLNKNTYRAIKMQTGTTIDVEKFINDCINEYTDGETGNGLFNSKSNLFWSESFLRRMQKYEDLKEKRSQAGKKAMQNRWGNKQNNNKVITNVIRNSSKVITKNNKLNEIKLKEIKSIYPSSHKPQEIQKIDMDETDKIEFETMISNCEMHILSPGLAIEITEILKEMYIQQDIREKVKEMNSKRLLYALKKFAIANTKSQIQIPKSYFKKCIITALEQTELSSQYDAETIILEE